MDENLADHEDILEQAESNDSAYPREREFVQDMRDKLDKYGDRATISEKQLKWLTDIAER